jgi:hypothetical protein
MVLIGEVKVLKGIPADIRVGAPLTSTGYRPW